MRDNFDLYKWKEYQLFLNEQEEFSLEDNDLELTKDFQNQNITKGSKINANMFKNPDIIYRYIGDGNFIVKKIYQEDKNGVSVWKINLAEEDNPRSIFKMDLDDVQKMLLNGHKIILPKSKLKEEEFSLGDEDLELAKRFQDFNIEIIGYSTYTFHNYEDDDNDLVEKTTKCIINSEDLERELGIPIPHNPEEIESIIYDNIWDSDFLMEKILEGDEVIEDIPDYYFESPWENEWEDLQVDVKILDKVNESFELTADDLEMAKDFNPNIIYLGKGDTIEPGIINSRGSYYIVGFEGNNILLKKDNSEYVSKFSINMVQNKMEDGYILDPYK
jgi:hypothetical protein